MCYRRCHGVQDSDDVAGVLHRGWLGEAFARILGDNHGNRESDHSDDFQVVESVVVKNPEVGADTKNSVEQVPARSAVD